MDKQFAIKPCFKILIDGKNITDDISAFVSEIQYVDRIEAESDDINIVIDDITGIWMSEYYPTQGSTLELEMGYPGNMLDCGLFEIDEIEYSGRPRIMTVKAIAAAITTDMRTRNSRAYESQSLQKIAQFIADKHGLTLTGDTSKLANIEVGRKTQNNESDLSFLSNLAKRFGIIFSVRGEQLVFLNPEDLEASDSVMSLTESQLTSYSFKDKTSDTYESAEVSRRDVKTNSVTKWRVENSGDPSKKDSIVVGGRVENEGQADAVAEGAIREKNKDKLTATFSIDGNPLLVSGVNVDMLEFGAFSGKWTIRESRHIISVENGYTTDVSLRKGPYIKTFEPVKHAVASTAGGSNRNWADIVGLK